MIKYLTFFKLKFISGLQYRMSALAGILTQFFFGIVFIMVYMAFYSSGANSPMNINQIVTYVWLMQAFYSLTYIYHRENDIVKIIRNGDVSYELCRPNNLYFMWFSKIYGTKLSSVLLKFSPIIIISLFLKEPYNLIIPDFYHFLGFIITLFFGSILIVSIVTLIHILMLYLKEDSGILSIYKVIGEFFAGGIVPIPFLPNFLQKISSLLPFQYISDVPMRIYVNNIDINNTFKIIIIQIIWIIVIVSFSLILTKKATKKLVIQGG